MKPHRARIFAIQAIYQTEFQHRTLDELTAYEWVDYEIPEDEKEFAAEIIKGVLENIKKLDDLIKEYSEYWDFSRISPVNKAILRVALYQLIEMKDTIPTKVVIDEAIHLGDEYAEKDSTRFINGLLDSFYKKQPDTFCKNV